MTLLRLVAVAAAALIASTFAGDQAQAQTQTPGSQRQDTDRRSTMDRDRMERDLTPAERRARDRRGRQPSPEQVTQSAQAAATAAGLTCQVSESALLGTTNDNDDLYEVACAGGGGYILTTASPPQSFECLVLAAQADRIRAEGGEVAANSTCNLPGNQSAAATIAAFAVEAGVSCQVDAGKALGATPEGNLVYEVGCAGVDGFHIERTAQGWKATDCLQIMATSLTCEFTTVAEQVAGYKTLLVGTAIDDCDPARIHLLAQNDTGRFIEVKCVSGEGYVTRVKDDAVGQVYPCALAVRIGGGCTMTPVPAPDAAPPSDQ
ncbi:hypothetical protein [Brevundimonas sp.]|uniref:hypothetical protein n=1 Tax=Brevundimonas sp. TaxID=1871086 RepID=UPI00272F8AA2|nr:hypothetical protein [Brevundimonas sp.]MDP1913975.1 hypothetical protein [Brevundimonas sp.]